MVRLASDAVGVAELEPALVLLARLEVENAAGKAVGDGVFEVFTFAEDALAADADQRQGFAPAGIAHLTKVDGDRGVAVGVTGDGPFEAEVVERWMLDGEAAGLGSVLGLAGGC